MKKLTALLFASAVALLFSLSAMAGTCPRLVNEIDGKMASMSLPVDKAAAVKALRDKGSDLHKAGKHAESVAVLREALEMLK